MAKSKVTQRIYDAAKILLESGNTVKETAAYLKLSYMTVDYISRSETFEEYKAIVLEKTHKARQTKAIKAKEAAKEAAKKAEEVKHEEPAPRPAGQTITIQANWQMMQEMQKTNELLKLISNKLGAIIDDLYGTGGADK